MERRIRIDHVGLWVDDLERMREFYVRHLAGRSGPLYHNARTGFRSYFIAFGGGARLELMHDGLARRSRGYAHLALAVGSRKEVDALVSELSAAGVVVAGAPRTTGDGYYEAVVLDPEDNRVEITAG